MPGVRAHPGSRCSAGPGHRTRRAPRRRRARRRPAGPARRSRRASGRRRTTAPAACGTDAAGRRSAPRPDRDPALGPSRPAAREPPSLPGPAAAHSALPTGTPRHRSVPNGRCRPAPARAPAARSRACRCGELPAGRQPRHAAAHNDDRDLARLLRRGELAVPQAVADTVGGADNRPGDPARRRRPGRRRRARPAAEAQHASRRGTEPEEVPARQRPAPLQRA